jgi:hypothetical protein
MKVYHYRGYVIREDPSKDLYNIRYHGRTVATAVGIDQAVKEVNRFKNLPQIDQERLVVSAILEAYGRDHS